MAGRISNGLELTGQCWKVLKLDKELLLFPIISSIACFLVLLSFAAPLFFSGILDQIINNAPGKGLRAQGGPVFYLVLFAFYFVNYAVVAFFNSALVACAIERFGGGNPTLGSGLAAASSRLPQILGWALVGATVGMILQMIAERSKLVGNIVARLLGAAWSIATYFVVPVLVVEKVGPIEAVKRSASIMRKTWGEALVGNAGISFVVFLVSILALVPVGIGIAITAGLNAGPLPIIVGGALTVLCMLVIGVVSATLKSILVAALYEYAASGRVPDQFDGDLLKAAFRPK